MITIYLYWMIIEKKLTINIILSNYIYNIKLKNLVLNFYLIYDINENIKY